VQAGLQAICTQRFCRPTTGSTWWRRFAFGVGLYTDKDADLPPGVCSIMRLLIFCDHC
jgi:hypothetical protein